LSAKSEIEGLLAQAVASAQAGRREQAYDLLLHVVELDRHNEVAWLWLSTVTDSSEDQRICLENVLTINPDNAQARDRLASLSGNGHSGISGHIICPRCGAGNRDFVTKCSACGYALARHCPRCGVFNPVEAQACSQCGTDLTVDSLHSATSGAVSAARPTLPITIWPVVAFWVSVSLFFIGGGMLSLYQFAEILLYARGVLRNLSPIEAAWLPMGLFFLVFGFTGFSLATQLAQRRATGYYGSLVFGLVLAVLGPGASLVLEPPNYLTTACTGLMPAAAVLLTLASIAGFES
jgi:ribosomal protein L40E